MTEVTCEKLCFYMTGEGATNIARDLWTEDNIQHTLEVVEEGFNLPLELAFDLMEGRRKFVGDTRGDGMLDLVEDDGDYVGPTPRQNLVRLIKSYTEDAQYIAATSSMYRKKRSRAYRGGIGSEIEAIECMRGPIEHTSTEAIKKYSNILYFATRLKISPTVLHDMIMACSQEFTDIYLSDTDEHAEASLKVTEYLSNISGGEITSVEDYIKRQSSPNALSCIAIRAGESKSGYLSPDGKFYACGYMEHLQLQEVLIGGGLTNGFTSSSKELIDVGWIKVSAARFTCNDDKKVTKRQINFIYDFFEAHKLEKTEWNLFKWTLRQILEHIEA